MTSKKTILLAEDDELLRMFAAVFLVEAGFSVIEAADAEDALAILRAQADEIDLLFTDINMPGALNGLDLAHFVRKSWPRIALLIASGDRRTIPAKLPADSGFLAKPYAPTDIVSQVQSLIAA